MGSKTHLKFLKIIFINLIGFQFVSMMLHENNIIWLVILGLWKLAHPAPPPKKKNNNEIK